MIFRIRRMLLLSAIVVGAACADTGTEPPMSDDAFVNVMVALRRAAITHAEDAAAFEAEKQAILQEAQIADSTLQAYVRARSGEPQRLAEVFSVIRDSLRPATDTSVVRPGADPEIIQ